MRRIRSVAIACAISAALAGVPTYAWAETSAEVREQAAAVSAELEGVTEQIAQGEQRVRDLQEEIDQLADESIELQGKLIDDRQRLSQVVSEAYKQNSDARVLALILSSESMDELISQLYYAKKVSDWQAECIERLEQDKEELAQQMSQVDAAKREQEATIEELSAQHDELDALVDELNEKADRLQAEEEEAARKAAEEARRKAEEARRKAEEERKAKEKREAEERARQEALKAAQEAGDVPSDVQATATEEMGTGWIRCIASAYTIADNDPPGSTATASGIPLDESVPTVAMPMSMSPSRFYGAKIEISYNGMSVIATVTDCGYMGGGSRGLDLTPAVFHAFGVSTGDEWGLREVSYRFL